MKLAGSIVNNMKELIREKETKSTKFSVKSVKVTFILFKCHRDLLIIPMIFIFSFFLEKAHD